MYVRLGNAFFGLVLALVGAWYLARTLLHPGPWFAGATWSVLAIAALVAAVSTRAAGWLVAAFFALGTAAYAFLDAYLSGGLPGSFFFVFLALVCFAVYQFVTRPARWPLALAGLLLAFATLLWVLGLAFRYALYLLPLALLVWGILMLLGAMRRPDRSDRP